jgi:hypothetical protein
MSPAEVLRELERIAKRIGVEVCFEAFDRSATGRGGLCKVRGKRRIVVDGGAPVVEQIAVLEASLAKLDLDTVFVSPFVRARIEKRRAQVAVTGPALRKAIPRSR